MRLAPNDTARPEPKLELVQIPVATDAKTTPAKVVNAIADTSARTSTSPKQSANRAILKSGILLGVSVTATSLAVGAANSVMYEWMKGATSAMVQSFVNTLNTMAGQQFIDRWNMLERRYIGYGVAAPRHAGGGATMPAGLEDNFMQTFRRKAAMNNRVLGARNNYLMYSRLLQWHVSAVGSKLDRGEMMSAARLLAGAMVHDRALWFEIRPSEPQMLFFLRVMLSPYFMKLAPEKRQELAAKVKAEILRIDSRAATSFDAAYAPLLNTLLAEPSAARRVDAPADKANAAQPAAAAKPLDAGMRTLLGRISEAGDDRKLSLDDINLIINAQGTNPNAKLDLTKALPSARFQKRVLQIIADRCAELKASTGRDLEPSEQWSLAQNAFRQALQERAEARAAGTSAGLYAAAGAASSLVVAGVALGLPAAAMFALNPVFITMVGLLMTAAGSTFQDWLSSNSSELNYQMGSEGVLMSEPLQREALALFFRNAAVDGRPAGQRNAFITFGQGLCGAAMSAEDFILRHDLKSAADVIGQQLLFDRALWFEMEADPNLLRLLMWKVTPHFDRCTMADRQTLKGLVVKYIEDSGRAGSDMSGYYAPFIDGMLMSNIPPEVENAPAAVQVQGANRSRGILGRILDRVFTPFRSR